MIVSGASGALGYLPELLEGVNFLFSDSYNLSFELIVGILATLTAFGGIGVIIAGVIMTTSHVEA